MVETGGTILAAAMPGKIKTFSQMFAIIFLLLHWTLLGQVLLYVALFSLSTLAMTILRVVPMYLKDIWFEMKSIIDVKIFLFAIKKIRTTTM